MYLAFEHVLNAKCTETGQAYRRDGVAGLVDGRRTRESSPTGRMDARLVSLIANGAAAGPPATVT